MATKEDWVPSATLFSRKPVRIENFYARKGIIDHHYRHALLLAWGNTELKNRLYPDSFQDADEDVLACLLDWELDWATFPTPPPSSALAC